MHGQFAPRGEARRQGRAGSAAYAGLVLAWPMRLPRPPGICQVSHIVLLGPHPLAVPPQVRCAGAVWLVSLLLHCGRHPRLVPLLPDAQEALSQLLGDQNELTQVRGSASWRQLLSLHCRKALLCHLGQTLPRCSVCCSDGRTHPSASRQ